MSCYFGNSIQKHKEGIAGGEKSPSTGLSASFRSAGWEVVYFPRSILVVGVKYFKDATNRVCCCSH